MPVIAARTMATPHSATAISNRTKGTVLHERPYWARTMIEQSRGLMFTRPGERCIIFIFLPSRRVHMHMWFVFGSIDIIALDGTGKVIALKERLRPWAFWSPGVDASAVVELPVGTIAATRTALGDVIALPQTSISSRHHP